MMIAKILFNSHLQETPMKKQYTIIILLLIWTVILLVKPIIESLPNQAQKEYESYMNEMYEKGLAVEAQFDNAVTYCKEHEEDLMKVSELFLEQCYEYYEDITPEETNKIAQNNTSLEWMILSEKLSLRYLTGYDGKCVYYLYAGGGNSILYIVYLDVDDSKVYNFDIGSETCLQNERVNDNLYVCILQDQMIGL